MNYADWARHFNGIYTKAKDVVEEIVDPGFVLMDTPLTDLIGGSADLAERVVKLMLDLKGIDAEPIHDVARLARQWPADDDYARRIAALNGGTRVDHVSDYDDFFGQPKGADNLRALERAAGALRLLWDILEDDALGGSGIARQPLSDSLREEVSRHAGKRADSWARNISGALATASVDEQALPFVNAMRADAQRIGAWASHMAEEIRRHID